MIKMELKNLTKSYEKGKLAGGLRLTWTKWCWKIDLNEPDYAEFRTR